MVNIKYNTKTERVFKITACQITKIFYNNLYIEADRVLKKSDGNITDIYKSIIRSYTERVMNNRKEYINILNNIYELYKEYTHSELQLFSEFINLFVNCFVPKELHSALNDSEKVSIISDVLKKIIGKTALLISDIKNLIRIIDDRNNRTNINYFQELILEEIVLIRSILYNDFHQKLIGNVNTSNNQNLPREVFEDLKKKCKKLIQRCRELELENKQLRKIIERNENNDNNVVNININDKKSNMHSKYSGNNSKYSDNKSKHYNKSTKSFKVPSEFTDNSSKITESDYTDSKYTNSKYTKPNYSGSNYTESNYTDSKYTDSNYTKSNYTKSNYTKSNYAPSNAPSNAPSSNKSEVKKTKKGKKIKRRVISKKSNTENNVGDNKLGDNKLGENEKVEFQSKTEQRNEYLLNNKNEKVEHNENDENKEVEKPDLILFEIPKSNEDDKSTFLSDSDSSDDLNNSYDGSIGTNFDSIM